MWFAKHKERAIKKEEIAEQSTIEVIEINQQVRQTANKTKRDIDRLNKLLKANGITLKIHIAAGGRHG